ncbi:MAG: lysine--tRNA ligase [Candidatus Nomurabacteria bacterium]|jgi:lysyl-tRNA synthetase class 2|nr:lysine--tRNA ligase [Candidatus Nomurabacteria bacterium]
MATLEDFRNERLRKLGELNDLGIEVYPANALRDTDIEKVVDDFDELEGKKVIVAGRITAIRSFGKMAFLRLRDYSGEVQIFWSGETTGLQLSQIGLLDTGDFVEVAGEVGKTKTGEISVMASEVRLLTKALRPLPGRDGFTNKEERYRRRYVDLNVNLDVRERFVRKSKFWTATREFLNNHGFIEMDLPILEKTTGGADANPFTTHMDALDQDYYLRISHELPLKRLIGGGYEKVYSIGTRFRNEGMDDEHLPEHVAMEWYAAYWDWQRGMDFTEELVRFIADKTWGKRVFEVAGRNGEVRKIDFGADGTHFPRISFVEIIREKFGVDVFNTNLDEIKAKLGEDAENIGRGVDNLWKKIRGEIVGPAFLVDIPVFLQPLAKRSEKDPRLTEQFNLLLDGTEACKAYSELNDPLDQLARFNEQQAMRDAGDDEAMMLDMDFVEMLEYGMPPTCGYGHSERLFWLLEGVSAREGSLFPPMRG